VSAAHAVLAALSEADRAFGPTTSENRAEKIAFVQQRVRALKAESGVIDRYEPKGFDAKARAAGEDA
jgi:hypothetical protein